MSDQPYVLKSGDTMTGTLEMRTTAPGRPGIAVYDHPIQVVNGHIQSFGDGSPMGGGFEARDANFFATNGDFYIAGDTLGHGFGWGLRGEFGGLYRGNAGVTLRLSPDQQQLWLENNDGGNRRAVLDSSGGELNGPLTIMPLGAVAALRIQATGTTWPTMIFNKSVGQASQLVAQKTGLNRWNLMLTDNTPEDGGNTGSDLRLYRYDDAGAAIGAQPLLQIEQASGVARFAGPELRLVGWNAASAAADAAVPKSYVDELIARIEALERRR